MPKQSPTTSTNITYIVSQYPAISHTFILSEINGLIAAGLTIQVASINLPDRPYDKLTTIEQEAYQNTVFVKSILKKKLLYYLFDTLLSFPKGFFKAFGNTLKAGLRYPQTLPKHLAYWLEAMVIANMVKQNGSKQLHAHFSTQACTVSMLAAEITGINFSFTTHGPDEFYHVHEQQLEKKFAAANFIICISDFAKSQVMKYTAFDQWNKLYVNPLGVDASLFHPAPKKNKTPRLLCVGRLVNAKGQGVLIQAAKLLTERNIDFEIDFVGDGPDREKLEQFSITHALIKHIRFLGKINHDQIPALMQQVDIFVLPSFAEGIPVVLMEAMASGLPCVTTHITGIPELLTHEHDGLLVPPGNAHALAHALERLIIDPSLRDQLSQKASMTIKEKWCLHKSNQRLAALLRPLLTQ